MARLRDRAKNRFDGKPLPLKPAQIVYNDLYLWLAEIEGRLTEDQSYDETKQGKELIAQAISDMTFELVVEKLKSLGRL